MSLEGRNHGWIFLTIPHWTVRSGQGGLAVRVAPGLHVHFDGHLNHLVVESITSQPTQVRHVHRVYLIVLETMQEEEGGKYRKS